MEKNLLARKYTITYKVKLIIYFYCKLAAFVRRFQALYHKYTQNQF